MGGRRDDLSAILPLLRVLYRLHTRQCGLVLSCGILLYLLSPMYNLVRHSCGRLWRRLETNRTCILYLYETAALIDTCMTELKSLVVSKQDEAFSPFDMASEYKSSSPLLLLLPRKQRKASNYTFLQIANRSLPANSLVLHQSSDQPRSVLLW